MKFYIFELFLKSIITNKNYDKIKTNKKNNFYFYQNQFYITMNNVK